MELHRERFAAQPRASALGTRPLSAFEPFVPPHLLARVFLVKPAKQKPRTVPTRTPAVLRVEREQPRIEFLKASSAFRTRTPCGEDSVLHQHDTLAELLRCPH